MNAQTPVATELTTACGHHCGIKDGTRGHCQCPDCHGSRAAGCATFCTLCPSRECHRFGGTR